jgi:hypothetical protein
MATAVEIVQDAMAWLNRLSPGETLNADDLSRGFDRLNTIVDKWSATRAFLYKSVITSATQTGNITLAAGSWAAIPVGTEIVSISVDGDEISQITMQQYASLEDVTTTGSPTFWAHDGLANIYLVPVANADAMELLHRTTVTAFADTTTNYTMPPGYKAALGITLACSLASVYNPGILPLLKIEERSAMQAVNSFKPMILDTFSYTEPTERGLIFNG